ncbi:GDP-mannose 4,6-dehydratase [Halobellus limi]|uniref:NAD-dependent epimerase/dehydratase family protein n=1 Tax=Halobellus limi TaxID=699433 RepID=A0A1H5USA5_9EURY|nr:GDP-mannose 4,6-dehydratase [Halobellus limi]QCC46941.1 NAD-dependent epimerase/dehydratase family protein [Halobellus limi]SEF77854.1 UDP-glucose 4-epimerase [Halobellus limi]
MQVLVTGGAGFIGSNLAEGFLDAGHRVVVLDNLDPYYDLGIKEHNLEVCHEAGDDHFEFVEGSTTDEELVDEVVASNDVDVIFHQASKAGVRTSVEHPKAYNESNIDGIVTVLEAAADHGVDRVVNASSSSVYGVPEYLPYDEDHPNHPKSPYAVTKLAAEHYCNVYDDLRDLSTVNLRYFTVYGPRMRPNMAISNFVSRCLNGEPPIIYGDGEQTRDFTFIDDVVEANRTLLETSDADGESMNVGSNDNISIRELAEYIVAETGADVDIVHEEAKDADARHTHADVSKAGELIDYEPTTDIREGVSKFIDWYEANREWYEPLVRNS